MATIEQIQHIRQGEILFEGNAIVLNYQDFQQVIKTMSALAEKAIKDALDKVAELYKKKEDR